LRNIIVLKNGIPTKYCNIKELIIDFVKQYCNILEKRKNANIIKLDSELLLISEKLRFIILFREGKIDIHRKNSEIIEQLKLLEFIEIESDYKHLTSISIVNLFNEQKDRLEKKYNSLLNEKNELVNISINEMYLKYL